MPLFPGLVMTPLSGENVWGKRGLDLVCMWTCCYELGGGVVVIELERLQFAFVRRRGPTMTQAV